MMFLRLFFFNETDKKCACAIKHNQPKKRKKDKLDTTCQSERKEKKTKLKRMMTTWRFFSPFCTVCVVVYVRHTQNFSLFRSIIYGIYCDLDTEKARAGKEKGSSQMKLK